MCQVAIGINYHLIGSIIRSCSGKAKESAETYLFELVPMLGIIGNTSLGRRDLGNL
jgi:hypothetical protein